MSHCPDWRSLVAHRYGQADAPAAVPAGWDDALAHLDGCTDCRGEALACDPTLAFSRPAPLAVTPVEIDDMRAAVAAMRRAGRVTGAATAEPGRAVERAIERSLRRPLRRPSWPALRRVAAAAVLTAGLLAATGATGPEPPASAAGRTVANLPVLEDLDRPGADVYHLEGDDLAVVMIVDTGLDV